MRKDLILGQSRSDGSNFTVNLDELPHLFITGQQGDCRRAYVSYLINSLLEAEDPPAFILMGSKSSYFSNEKNIKGLYQPVIHDPMYATTSLSSLSVLMNWRKAELASRDQENLDGLFQRIVVIIDDALDFFYNRRSLVDDVEAIATTGAKLGVHLILCLPYIATDIISKRIIECIPKKVDVMNSSVSTEDLREIETVVYQFDNRDVMLGFPAKRKIEKEAPKERISLSFEKERISHDKDVFRDGADMFGKAFVFIMIFIVLIIFIAGISS